MATMATQPRSRRPPDVACSHVSSSASTARNKPSKQHGRQQSSKTSKVG